MIEIASWLKKGGVNESTFQDVLQNSQQDSIATRRIIEVVVSRNYKPRKSWMPKDINFGLDMAREMETSMPFVSLASQMFAIGEDGYEATGLACKAYETINGARKG
jgi:3-hydroxyisobutyrate dehydrogenase-like beta-hydroxyacid dehydrogenase